MYGEPVQEERRDLRLAWHVARPLRRTLQYLVYTVMSLTIKFERALKMNISTRSGSPQRPFQPISILQSDIKQIRIGT